MVKRGQEIERLTAESASMERDALSARDEATARVEEMRDQLSQARMDLDAAHESAQQYHTQIHQVRCNHMRHCCTSCAVDRECGHIGRASGIGGGGERAAPRCRRQRRTSGA